MSSHEWVTVAVIVLVIGLAAAMLLELKFMRRKMKARRVRAAKRVEELPDDAHNGLLTTKAIASALERGGVRSDEVAAMLREAQLAYERQNYRVVLDLATKAKERLTALKARHTASGDLAKLDAMPAPRGEDEPTIKERLQKDFPPNMTQAKFTLELAEAAIEQGRGAGRDVAQAEQILLQARGQFDGQDYTGALGTARQAQRSAVAGPIPGWTPSPLAPAPSPSAAPAASAIPACESCGAPLAADDMFCRKCGGRVGPSPCASCGAPVASDDAFCRKCGAELTR